MNELQRSFRVVCLLPARNAAVDLPMFFRSARQYCDAIIALDDGSTDDTLALLEEEPLVELVLTNPRREDYGEWDDADNRNRLLDAAAQFDPEWIISIDADERLDEADAVALRTFLATDALPGCAYGFRHVPMREDERHFVPKYQWVYRLFSYSPGLKFPGLRLHFIPIPTSIPQNRWIKTTLRIQHFGGATTTRRLARYKKYLEADHDRRYQARYSPLLDANTNGQLRIWQSRPESMDVLLSSAQATLQVDEFMESPDDRILISVIVIAQNDEATIHESIEAIVQQQCEGAFEIILVTSGNDRTASIVRHAFPEVRIVELDRPALPGEARNEGLRIARGAIVTFPGSHVTIRPGNLAARLRSHRNGYAMVTGLVENGTFTPAGWASYFLDHADEMPGSPSAVLQGPPGHCSYSRLPLLEVGGFPETMRTAEDTLINRDLVRRGYIAYRDARVRFVHRSPNTTWDRLIQHHFRRGRGWGRLVVMDYTEKGNLLNRDVIRNRLMHHISSRLRRISDGVARADPEFRDQFAQVKVGVALGVLASWLGMWMEILRPTSGKLSILVGRPQFSVFVGTDGTIPTARLVQVDEVNDHSRSTWLPLALELNEVGAPPETLESFVHRVIGNYSGDGSELSQSRSAILGGLAKTFDIDRLDFLIADKSALRLRSIKRSRPESRVRALLDSTIRFGTIVYRSRTGILQTSLNPWQVLRIIDTLESESTDASSEAELPITGTQM